MGAKTVLGMITLIASISGFAAPERAFVGKDAISKKPCKLEVVKTFHRGNTGKWADLQLEVTSDYGHGKDTVGEMTLSTFPTDETLLGGPVDKNGKVDGTVTSLQVRLSKKQDLSSALAYKLRWLHGDHFHTFNCKDMKEIE